MFCPFNIAVVTLAPHTVNGYAWGPVVRPLGAACVTAIGVDPKNDSAWYVGGLSGLFMTKDGGHQWSKPLHGQVGPILVAAGPDGETLVYAGVTNRLYLTRDDGATWALLRSWRGGPRVRSLLVAGMSLYVGLHGDSHAQPSGVFKSNLGGGQWSFSPFGPGHTGLIVWSLARDHSSGALYAGTEIFDHPQPYEPPLFRSADGGAPWTDIAGPLPWHSVAVAVGPDGHLYALTEGAGLFGSDDQGSTWLSHSPGPGPTVSLLLHPTAAAGLLGGQQRFLALPGGAYQSLDGGAFFQPIGLPGVTVAGLAVNGSGTRVYAAAYASGIYTAPIPAVP